MNKIKFQPAKLLHTIESKEHMGYKLVANFFKKSKKKKYVEILFFYRDRPQHWRKLTVPLAQWSFYRVIFKDIDEVIEQLDAAGGKAK